MADRRTSHRTSHRSSARRGLTAAVVACATALALGACASDDASTSSLTDDTVATDVTVTTLPAPTGDPIVLAMISQESGPAAIPDARLAAEAAVDYVNTELGGAAGRPLQLETCVTDGSPEQSSACANQLLESDPVAFVGQSELGTSGSVPIIEQAGVPLIGPAAVTPELVLSEQAYTVGLDAVSGPAGWTKYLATEGGATDLGVIYVDIPAAPVINSTVSSVAEANGATVVDSVPLAVSASDASSQMAAATQGDPDAVVAVVPQQLCVPVLQAHASVAPDVPLLVPGICASPQVLDTAGAAATDVLVGFSFLNPYEPDADEQVATYRRIVDGRDEAVPLSEFASNAFAGIVDLKAVIDDLGGDAVDPAALATAFADARDVPNFMGRPISCDQPISLAPSVCVTGQRILQVQDGAVVDVGGDWYDGTADIDLG